jgi:HEAT repeat protein
MRRHSGDPAVALLQTFVRDPEPSVAAVALGRLVELDPKYVLPVLSVVLESPDANVRAFGVTVLDRVLGDGHLTKLADFTNDPHPAIRVQSRKALHRLAGEGRADVVREGTRILGGSNWRGQEQAAILLAQLDHKAAVPRLVEILSVDRGETMVAAAWAVRKLDVADALPAVLQYSLSLVTSLKGRGLVGGRKAVQPDEMDAHLCQLVQFLGKNRHRPSESFLRELVPPSTSEAARSLIGAESRSAAVWALGKIHEGTPDPALRRLFLGRLNAINPGDVEDYRVRAMCAIALARMKETSAVDTLRKYFVDRRPGLDRVNNSCGWALERLTGEKMEAPAVVEGFDLDWFLRPAK